MSAHMTCTALTLKDPDNYVTVVKNAQWNKKQARCLYELQMNSVCAVIVNPFPIFCHS